MDQDRRGMCGGTRVEGRKLNAFSMKEKYLFLKNQGLYTFLTYILLHSQLHDFSYASHYKVNFMPLDFLLRHISPSLSIQY